MPRGRRLLPIERRLEPEHRIYRFEEGFLLVVFKQWGKLFGGTVPPNNTLFGRTVLPNNTLFGGTVPPNSTLFGRTPDSDK